jgi:hypothetical protein
MSFKVLLNGVSDPDNLEPAEYGILSISGESLGGKI